MPNFLHLPRELRHTVYSYLTVSKRNINAALNDSVYLKHGPITELTKANHQLCSEYMDHIQKVADLNVFTDCNENFPTYPATKPSYRQNVQRVTIYVWPNCLANTEHRGGKLQAFLQHHRATGRRYLARFDSVSAVRYKVGIWCEHGDDCEGRQQILAAGKNFKALFQVPFVSGVEVVFLDVIGDNDRWLRMDQEHGLVVVGKWKLGT